MSAKQLPLIALPPAQQAKRRGKNYPTWKVVTRCLDCPMTWTQAIVASDPHWAKKRAHEALEQSRRAPEHRHRYASAAGPA